MSVMIAMNDLVQFIRNGLSCVKDWQIGPSWLHDPNITAQYYELPEPLNHTTPLEVLVSPFQLYPFIFLTKAGCEMTYQSYSKFGRIQWLMDNREGSDPKKGDVDDESNDKMAARLVEAKLIKDFKRAIRDFFVGTQLAFTGLCFGWLFANSWHITDTPWIGGILGLIHALTVMEITLLVFLYYMIVDGNEKFKTAQTMIDLAKILEEKGEMTHPFLVEYELMSHWDPFWGHRDGTTKDLKEETMKVQRQLELYRGSGKKDDGEKESKLRRKTMEGIAERLKEEAITTRYEGYREYLYFVLNLVAFYGYLLGILVYYFEEENEAYWLRKLKLHLPHDHAEWHGNFAGDLMWTIEPMVATFSPFLFSLLKPTLKKEAEKTKAD